MKPTDNYQARVVSCLRAAIEIVEDRRTELANGLGHYADESMAPPEYMEALWTRERLLKQIQAIQDVIQEFC